MNVSPELQAELDAEDAARNRALKKLVGTTGLKLGRYAPNWYVVTLHGEHIGVVSPYTKSGERVVAWRGRPRGTSRASEAARDELEYTAQFPSKPKAAAALHEAHRREGGEPPVVRTWVDSTRSRALWAEHDNGTMSRVDSSDFQEQEVPVAIVREKYGPMRQVSPPLDDALQAYQQDLADGAARIAAEEDGR